MEGFMKRVLSVTILMSLFVFAGAVVASAETENTGLIKIPFAFHAGSRLMPAGDYRIEMPEMGGFATGTMLKISTPDGVICEHLFSMRIDGVTTDNDYHVTFSKYGDSYLLSKVRNSNLGAQLARSQSEKKMSHEFAKGSPSVSTHELILSPSRAK
jgi:hypothetical protein